MWWISSFYCILPEKINVNEWNKCRFFVDDVPIRRYPRKSDATFPLRPMYIYGSIWDASSWATENGRYKADYKYQPFYGRYNNFKLVGCTSNSPSTCRPPSGSPARTGGLSRQQVAAMSWVQKNFKVYDYCRDPKRDHTQTPECWHSDFKEEKIEACDVFKCLAN